MCASGQRLPICTERGRGRPCVLVLALAGALIAVPLHAVARQSDTPVDAPYTVGPQDVLAITLWAHPDMSGTFKVEPDGTFSYPLIGRVTAGGRTLRAIEQQMSGQLAQGYFKDPQVSVIVAEYHSRRVFIVGEIRQPGAYPISDQMTLLELLATAGPLTPTASGEGIIVRPPAGTEVTGPILPDQMKAAHIERIDLRAVENGSPQAAPSLKAGDTLLVPRVESIYVFGQVRNPGAYPVQRSTTVLQALALAGGITERGATGRIKIVRIVGGEKVELKVSLNDLVQPGDTITVPERYF
jgi:polysaccharide biosynthesis/export protein